MDDAVTLQGQALGYRYRILLHINYVMKDDRWDIAIEVNLLG